MPRGKAHQQCGHFPLALEKHASCPLRTDSIISLPLLRCTPPPLCKQYIKGRRAHQKKQHDARSVYFRLWAIDPEGICNHSPQGRQKKCAEANHKVPQFPVANRGKELSGNRVGNLCDRRAGFNLVCRRYRCPIEDGHYCTCVASFDQRHDDKQNQGQRDRRRSYGRIEDGYGRREANPQS